MSIPIEREFETIRPDIEKIRFKDYIRHLPEPENPRTEAMGISIIPDNGIAMDSAIWMQRVQDGYELSLSVVDIASGEMGRFSGPDAGFVKAITIKSVLDLELESQKFEISFTNLQSLAVIRDSDVMQYIKDDQSELHILLKPYFQIAHSLKEKRKYEGALDDAYSKASSFIRGDYAVQDIQVVRREFLHLAKKAVAEKFAQDNTLALYENWFESQSGMPVVEISAAEEQFDKNPTETNAAAIISLIKSGMGKRVHNINPAGHVLYNDEAHLKFTIPAKEFSSYINLIILHGVLTGDNPYTPQQIDIAINTINGKKGLSSPYYWLSPRRRVISKNQGDSIS